jgi:hypothetical protein
MSTALHQVMHGVAIKKHGDAPAIAEVAGLPLATVERVLAEALAGGRVSGTDGKYLLTPAGHMIVSAEYSRFCADLRGNAGFVSACERFEVINKDLKQLITDWQTRDIGGKRVANDHRDSAYDERVLDRLGALHERFEPLLGELVQHAPRLAVYRRKLGEALEQAEDGDPSWVSDARRDSYHTVWFELHEDLLRLLGRSREE